jgi:hypothetical protein
MEFVTWVFGTAGRDLPSGTEKKLWGKDAQRDVFKAARRGDPDELSKLMRRDQLVDVHAVEDDGCTLLMAAAQRGHLDMIERLLEMNFKKLNAIDDKSLTALDHARKNGNPKVLEYMLVRHTAKSNDVVPFVESLFPALERGDVEAVRQSIRPRVAYQVYLDRHEGDLIGIETLPCGPAELVVKAINHGLIDNWNQKRDALAVKPGDHLIQINEVSGDFSKIKKELAQYQEMTLTFARYSLDESFDPNLQDQYGNPVLHLAVRSGKLALVEALASSPDLMVNEKDRYGRTALDVARDNEYDDIATFLESKCGRSAQDMTSPSRRTNKSMAKAKGYDQPIEKHE